MTASDPPPPLAPRIDFARVLAGSFRLDGQVAFVPGGYGGIGEAVCWSLALAGARPVIVGRSAAKADVLAAAIRAAGHSADSLAADATQIDAMRAAIDVGAAAEVRRAPGRHVRRSHHHAADAGDG